MKDLFRLDGKVAVVIGGAGGIGQGIAEAMAFYGAEVVIASRKMESLVRAKSEIKEKVGKDVAIYTVDATNEDSIIALVNTVVSNHKKADILVNAQGYNKKFSLFDFPMDVMADMMNVNVIGVAMACKHFGKVMKENGYGRIINLSSVRGVRAFSGGGGNMGYCTSKGRRGYADPHPGRRAGPRGHRQRHRPHPHGYAHDGGGHQGAPGNPESG